MGRCKRMIPFLFDLKTVLYGGYFVIIAFFFLFVYQWIVMGGSKAYFIQIQTPMFFIAAIGVLVWVLPAYADFVNTESQELMLSFPLGGIWMNVLRAIRLNFMYILVILGIFYFFYCNSDLKSFECSTADVFIITASIFFMSGLGLFSLVIGKHLAFGFAVPIFWLFFSYCYNGAGTWILHPCQWLKPKYALLEWQAVVGMLFAGLILNLIANWLLLKREYLMKS